MFSLAEGFLQGREFKKSLFEDEAKHLRVPGCCFCFELINKPQAFVIYFSEVLTMHSLATVS